MLLDINLPEHSQLIYQYGKAKGVALLHKYLPEINIFKLLYVVYDDKGLEELLTKNLGSPILVRADSKIGEKQTFLFGQTLPTKKEVKEYYYKLKEENPNGAMICMNTYKNSGERIKTDGGFNIAFEIGKHVIIDFVGNCFDSRECTRGKACHETFLIPWNEAIFLEAGDLNKYKVHSISQKAYEDTVEDRKSFLISSGYNQEEIEKQMPLSPKSMNMAWKRKILNQVIIPILEQEDNLKKDKLYDFGIQANLIGEKIIPFEINRPERSI